jgi:hypothetical protein
MTFTTVTGMTSKICSTKNKGDRLQPHFSASQKAGAVLLTAVCTMLLLITPCRSQNFKPVRVGDTFTPFTLTSNLSTKELEVLKLPAAQKTISLNDLKADIVVVEMLNVHCHTCQLQMPVFNKLWDAIQADKVLKSKVAMIGITVGNNAEEIVAFHQEFQPRYPILADPFKAVYNSLSDPKGTPQTYLIRRDTGQKWFILYHHRGAVDSHDIYLEKIKGFFKTSLEGTEPGYRVPQVIMQELQKKYSAQSFTSKQILLYFPSSVTFPLETDSRNRKNQMPVLLSLLKDDKLALVIIGTLNQLFPAQDLATLGATPGTFLLDDGNGMFKKLFAVDENPLICLINDAGGIVYRGGALTSAQAAEVLEGTVPALTSSLSDDELMALLQGAMKEINPEIDLVDKKEMTGGSAVYVGFTPLSIRADEGVLFGRVVSKYSICDVCHDVHFYFIFDQSGKLLAVKSIKLTKYGNADFTPDDLEKLQGSLGGKNLFRAIPFDPAVDAITQGTMSSYLVFEGVNDTRTVLGEFKENGFRKEHWKEQCLANLCQIKKALLLYKQSGASDKLILEDQTSLNMSLLKPFLSSAQAVQCPTRGKYLLIGDAPLCSTHGMNILPCPGEEGAGAAAEE